jgi:hypothetical protein
MFGTKADWLAKLKLYKKLGKLENKKRRRVV